MTKKKKLKLDKRRAAPHVMWKPKDAPAVRIRDMEGSHLTNAFNFAVGRLVENGLDCDAFAGKILPRLSVGNRALLTDMVKEMRWRGYFEAGRLWRVPMDRSPKTWSESATRVAAEISGFSPFHLSTMVCKWTFCWEKGRCGGKHIVPGAVKLTPPKVSKVADLVTAEALKQLMKDLAVASKIDQTYGPVPKATPLLNYCPYCTKRILPVTATECKRKECLLKRLKAAEEKPLLADTGHTIRRPVLGLTRKRRIRLED